jgi:hypothetical protein
MATKICKRCKTEKPLDAFYTAANHKDGRQSNCKLCQIAASTAHRNNNPEYHREFHKKYNLVPLNRARALLRKALTRAKQKDVACTISVDRIAKAIAIGKCERTGIEFELQSHDTYSRHPFAPSIDKIDAFGDYSDANTVIVCNAYNLAKNQWTHDEFVDFCRKVVEFNDKKGA